MLTKIDQEWVWGEQEATFIVLKDMLASAPILQRPIPWRSYQLHTNWSTLGIWVVLTSMDNEGDVFVAYYISKAKNNVED